MVGRVGRPHGLAGFVAVHPDTDNPHRFRAGSRLVTDSGHPLTVEEARWVEGVVLVRFEGHDDRSQAEMLRGSLLTISVSERRPLTTDEYWPDQLEGLEVVGPDGTPLGRVAAVEEGAAQDRLLVETAAGTFPVPFVTELVPQVDLEAGQVVVVPIEGLLG